MSAYIRKTDGVYIFSPQKRLKHGRQNITLHGINGIIRNNKCIFKFVIYDIYPRPKPFITHSYKYLESDLLKLYHVVFCQDVMSTAKTGLNWSRTVERYVTRSRPLCPMFATVMSTARANCIISRDDFILH
jgi:hypothetical protein